jgi:hypothetical protein
MDNTIPLFTAPEYLFCVEIETFSTENVTKHGEKEAGVTTF